MATTTKATAIRLWTTQGLLAALFLFAGAMKFIMPLDVLKLPVPVGFLHFIGAAEVLGALGLVLPGVLNIARALTPIAATGLVMIMAGATAMTVEGGVVAPALMPLVVGVLAITVAYGRRAWLASSADARQERSRVGSGVPTLYSEGTVR